MFSGPGPAGNGGIGIDLAAATKLSNAGTILGGTGGASMTGMAGNGGDAIDAAGTITIKNTGVISAGAGGYIDKGYYVGSGGVGINGAHATVHLVNKGTIKGGVAGVAGYNRDLPAANGGAAIQVDSLTLTNSGSILGGSAPGFVSDNGYGSGGAGVGVAGMGHIVNHSLIQGGTGVGGYYYHGAAGGPGGVGLSLAAGTITNTGTIMGGDAGAGGGGGLGGNGVTIGDVSMTNSGTIIAGNATSGEGGIGVSITGGTLVTSGVIDGGQSHQGGGTGGVGVYLSSGTLITSGTIEAGEGKRGALANAVTVNPNATGADRIVVQAGAVFDGNVAGNNGNVTLELAGRTDGTLTGVGVTITGIPTIVEDAHTNWTLAGASYLATGATLSAAGTLALAGTLSGAGTLTLDKGGLVTAEKALTVASVDFASGGSQTLVLDEPKSATSTFSGFGSNDTVDLVKLIATSATFNDGTLTILNGSSTVDTLLFDGSYTSSNFTLTSDNNGGTDLKYVATGLPDFASAPVVSHAALPESTLLGGMHFADGDVPRLWLWHTQS
jgi:hypothetical protein